MKEKELKTLLKSFSVINPNFKVLKVFHWKILDFQGFQGHLVWFQGFQGFQGLAATLTLLICREYLLLNYPSTTLASTMLTYSPVNTIHIHNGHGLFVTSSLSRKVKTYDSLKPNTNTRAITSNQSCILCWLILSRNWTGLYFSDTKWKCWQWYFSNSLYHWYCRRK